MRREEKRLRERFVGAVDVLLNNFLDSLDFGGNGPLLTVYAAKLQFQRFVQGLNGCNPALCEKKRMTASKIAVDLGITNPAVSQLVSEMQKRGLITDTTCLYDKRRRWLTLTENGKALALQLQPNWDIIREIADAMVTETNHDVLGTIEALENALEQKSLNRRFLETGTRMCPPPKKPRQAVVR